MYVGQSRDIARRYREHSAGAGTDYNIPLFQWWAELQRKAQKPELQILEVCPALIDLDEKEREWIHTYKAKGEASLNRSVGGRARSVKRIQQATKEDWAQYADHIRQVRALLFTLADETGSLVSAQGMDGIMRLIRRLDLQVHHTQEKIRREFPTWNDVAQTLEHSIQNH